MAKRKSAYVCSDCGSDYSNWQGQCKDCGAWNTLLEISMSASSKTAKEVRFQGYAGASGTQKVQTLNAINLEQTPRFSSGMGEFDRVLGGGLVHGSAILIGGNPGAGKSTLLLQTLCHLSQLMDTLYVTGEESLQQVAMRAQRLQLPTDKLKILSETNVEAICSQAEQLRPKVLVVDSIQVVHSDC